MLGAALPDLAAMGGFRLQGSAAATPETHDLAQGIFIHHRTDEAFHRSRWFAGRNRDLYQDLERAGMARGPARACSHVGVELLLDGVLLNHQPIKASTTAAFGAIEGRRGVLGPLVRSSHADLWLAHLDRLAAHRLPSDYHEPDAVAQRLILILARRPRLAFTANWLPALTEALERQKPGIDATAMVLLDDLVDQVRPHLD